jgi:hypothetical protein
MMKRTHKARKANDWNLVDDETFAKLTGKKW